MHTRRENETLKNVGSKTSDAFSRAGTRIKESASSLKVSVTLRKVIVIRGGEGSWWLSCIYCGFS